MMCAHGSMAVLVVGFITAILLVLGGYFMYYYATTHATKTGRIGTRVCLILAPSLNMFTMFMYLITSFWATLNSTAVPVRLTSNYSSGFFMACILSVFTWLPFYIYSTFSKVDPFEKNEDDQLVLDESDHYAGYTGSYGTGGYGSDYASGYGTTGGGYGAGYGAAQ